MSIDFYQGITTQIIAMLDKGVVPWRSPILGNASAGHPMNLITEKPYRGVNVFLLAFTAWSKGYTSACWLTFNQAKSLGGSIKKGEKSSTVIFWKQLERIDNETQKPTTIPLLRYFNVFNVEQCGGITPPDAPAPEHPSAHSATGSMPQVSAPPPAASSPSVPSTGCFAIPLTRGCLSLTATSTASDSKQTRLAGAAY
jgi:antirestriction protein ArdC